jgi:hypothetical protein
MHDDDMLDDSWFDRPVKGQALTVEMVQAALHAPEADIGPTFEGLEDSWFDRPARGRVVDHSKR